MNECPKFGLDLTFLLYGV